MITAAAAMRDQGFGLGPKKRGPTLPHLSSVMIREGIQTAAAIAAAGLSPTEGRRPGSLAHASCREWASEGGSDSAVNNGHWHGDGMEHLDGILEIGRAHV